MKLLANPAEIPLSRQGFITNYPPYGHWRSHVPSEALQQGPLNVYIHIPYCIQRCAYCHYKTITLDQARLAAIDRYVDALCHEIALAVDCFHLHNYQVVTLYFGGGTPTLLSEANFAKIFAALGNKLRLDSPEITVEAEPVTLTAAKAKLLAQLGVNRISLGIQSFADEIVEKTGRKDREETTIAAIKRAHSTGAVVNIDLLCGLVGESPQTWAYSIERALAVAVPSITIYKMELYANTGYYAGVQGHSLFPPSDAEELALMRHALRRLLDAGYQPATAFTFIKGTNYAHRHIANRWRGQAMVAFGVSAFGQLGELLYQNTNDVQRYVDAVMTGNLPFFRGYRLTSVDRMLREILLESKLVRFDHAAFKQRHGIDLVRTCAASIADLEARALLTVDPQHFILTTEGILYGDYVGKILAASLRASLLGE